MSTSEAPEKRLESAAEAECSRFSWNIPAILHKRMMTEVRKRQLSVSKFSLTDWINETCRERLDGPAHHPPLQAPARQHQEPRVEQPAYLPRTTTRSAADIAAGIPGLSVGLSNPKPKGWLHELRRLARQGEVDPEGAATEESRLLDGFNRPKGWASLDLEHRAAHLDRFFPIGGASTGEPTEDW